MQVKHRRHLTILSSCPAMTLLGRKGSASSSRAMSMTSAWSFSKISSIMAGSLMAPDGGHRLGHVPFDLRRQVDIHSVGREHRGVGVKKAELIGTGGHMDQVHQVLQPLGDFTALRQVIAPLEQLRPAHAQFDGEGGAHLGADGGEDLPGKAAGDFPDCRRTRPGDG